MPAMLLRSFLLPLCATGVVALNTHAQVVLKAQPVEEVSSENQAKAAKPAAPSDLDASWKTQREARSLTLQVPAPRGQIVDRNGVPYAQNRVANYLALVMPYMEGAADDKIVAFAKQSVESANKLLGKSWSIPDDRVLSHYKHRRWLPLVFSSTNGINDEITPEMEKKLEPILGANLVLQSAYLRHYPQNERASHIIGYTGKSRPLPLGPIADGDPIFEEMEGRADIEKTFDSDLKGQPGIVNVLFAPDGKRLAEDVRRFPVPGRNVVLSIDSSFQMFAEQALQEHAKNGGAMVIMDIQTGDILAMASYPFFDLNMFIPGITGEKYEALLKDPKLPLIARAFRGEYPPASTFKAATALGILDSGKVDAKTYFPCSPAMEIGNRVFHNWSKNDFGSINVVNALKYSCNTWFYAAAIEAGADPVTGMCSRLGFGERTGIPIVEGEGFLPTNSIMIQRRGTRILPGDLANIAIGQGMVLATPLQVAQAMAGIANGTYLPQARLVKQIQDYQDNIISAFDPKPRKTINLNPLHRDTIVKGMVAVVSGDGGTGHAADIKHAQIAGKTGTAQWKIAKDQNLAWFAGFLPAQKPMFSFAVVYEGRPGEDVSGGRKAAPIVSEVFTKIFEKTPKDDPMLLAMQNVPKDTPIGPEDEEDIPMGKPVEEARPRQQEVRQAEQPKRTIGGFFRKLFGRD
ncbi:MAG: penicillin-binding transpeptidase domain-containing protein [Verrucomicrobiaceae bacterium]